MNTYIFSFLITNLLGFIIYHSKFDADKKNKIYSIVAFLIMAFVMGCRANFVGTDTYNYSHNIYQSIVHADNVSQVKGFDSYPGYIIYNKILSFISTNDQIVLLANAIITLGICAYLIYKMSPNVFASWFFFISLSYYILSFNISRQYLAMAIGYLGLYFFFSEKKLKGLLLLLCSVSIHNTVFILFLWILLSKIKFNKKKLVFLLIGTPLIFGIYTFLVDIFTAIFPRYISYLNLNMKNGNIYAHTGGGGRILVGFYVFFIVGIALYYDKKVKNREDYNQLCLQSAIIIISAWFMIILHKYSLLLRIEQILSVSLIIYIPNVIEKFIYKKGNRIIIYIILAAFSLIEYRKGLTDFLPYAFFWQN